MSIIQNIRDKGAWIIFTIIVIALVAFVLQDGIGKQGNTTETDLGTVNGVAINKINFEEKLEIQVQNYASQGVKREQLIGFLWNQEIDRILYINEQEKLGITIGNKELTDVLFGTESPFKQEFTDPNTGEFKVNDAKQAIAQVKKSKNQEQINQIEKLYIEPSIENRLRNKYQALIVKGLQLPTWMVQKQYNESNSIANIDIIGVPYANISDSTIKVTDDEVASYIKENAAAFQVEEASKSINFVGFSAAPTSTDSTSVLNSITALKADFQAAQDPAVFLNKVGSDLPFYNSFISGKSIQIPNKEAIIAAGVGNVYGPYVDGKNYTIAKVIGVKQWPDSASVRHILITTAGQNGQLVRDDSTAKKLIDSIRFAIAGGASFDAMVLKYSEDAGSKEKGGKYEMFPQAQMVGPFNDFSFDNSVGTKGVVKTDFGYHYIEVLKQTPRSPAYKIAYLSKAILPSSETIGAASAAAAAFATASKDIKSFNQEAVKLNKQTFPAVGIKSMDYEIPGLGESRSLVRWVYENDLNSVSEPTEIGDSYFVAIITGEEKAGLASVASAKPQVEGILRDQKKATQIKQSFKGNTMEAIAANAKTIVQPADSINFNYSLIPGIGNEPKLVGAAFNKAFLNKPSAPIAGNAGVFVISVKSQGAKAATQDLVSFESDLLNRTRSVIYRTNIALKKVAKIKDNRIKVY
ncbi:MAG: peptidylprolyl isomerase [Chitinophagaceae bacterium]|nr:peptidylprolyl isomerase [Chitinophagaceae bacterium]